MAKKGRTLWEMFLEWLQGPLEMRFYNPLKARIGSFITLDDVEWRDLDFRIEEIREYRRTIGGQSFVFSDYVLQAKPLHGEEVRARLRVNPQERPDPAGGPAFQVLLLQLEDEMAYDQGLHDVVRDPSREFQILEDGQVKACYWRIHDVTDSYQAQVSILRDVNFDQRVDSSEVERERIEYWDYWRETTDAAGQPVLEYLFVEMNQDNGWFQIWRGHEIDPQQAFVV